MGKANEVTAAIAKGVEAAKKNLIRVPVHKGTIPHEQEAKFGGSRVILKPASHGTGVKAGDSGESKGATTLSNLGNTVYSHKAVLQFEIVGRFYSVILICHDS